MTRTALALAGTLAAAAPALALPLAPREIWVVPVYSTPLGIRISWIERGGAAYYDIRRSIDDGPETPLVTISGGDAENLVRYLDAPAVATSTYKYSVEIHDATGSVTMGPYTTSPKVVWPIVGGHEVMQGWNEVIAWGAPVTGFHTGLDLNNTSTDVTAGNVIVAPRGGFVNDIQITGELDNGAIGIGVDVGDRIDYDTFNHIATTGPNAPMVVRGEIVEPGQPIAHIGTINAFPGNFAKHVHFVMSERNPKPDDEQRVPANPLSFFTDPDDRDPLGKPPLLFDENGDGKLVLFRNHSTGGLIAYNLATTPLRGDVDVEPEVVDEQGTNPRQAPIDLGYWIEGPLPDAEQLDDVKSAAHPYRLYNFRVEYFGGTVANPAPLPCNHVSDIADVANAGCAGLQDCFEEPLGTCNSFIKEDGTNPWPYPVLHHFIVTHAKGETGARADVDHNQFWRTAAKDDGAPAGSTHANYADQPTTNKAWEARFPDGDYTIHVVASDLVHENVDLKLPSARIENFAPFVKELMFARDLDGNPASGLPGFPGCELLARHYRHTHRQPLLRAEDLLVSTGIETMARSGHKVCVKLRFSEPVTNVMVDLVTQRGAGVPITGSAFTGAAAKTYQDNDTWSGTLLVPPDPTGASDGTLGSDENDVALRIRATDRRDAAGIVRNLDADGDGVADPADLNHVVLRLDTSPPSAILDVVKP
ncbi:MAG: hypothetical protein ACREQL_10145 [Candidatus Binatia bacterium]